MELSEQVRDVIAAGLPEARVRVRDLTGEGRALEVHVASRDFAGKNLLEQHRMVMGLLTEHLEGDLHAVQITTQPLPDATGER